MTPRPILEIGEQLGLREDELIPYGRHKAKVALKGRPSGFTVHISELRLLAGAGFRPPSARGSNSCRGCPRTRRESTWIWIR
ncbi:MAG: hypothetical protein ACREI9_16075 [Nitrospiraceae bacterium]